MGEGGRPDATAADIRRALQVLIGACAIQAGIVLLLMPG
jgi:hypothetical protein